MAALAPTSARGGVVAAILVTVFSTGVVTALAPMASAEPDSKSAETAYVVLFNKSGPDAAAERAIKQAGGRIVSVNTKIGYAYATSRNSTFRTAVAATGAVEGAAAERVVGQAPQFHRPASSDIERLTKKTKGVNAKAGRRTPRRSGRHQPRSPEPLADLQWDMRMIGATATGSYPRKGQSGSGSASSTPASTAATPTSPANFNAGLSRTSSPTCPTSTDPARSLRCVDPADVDDDGHGTHVASTIGSPINGLGIAGVAPKVTLMNIRAGQDSGFFFLQAHPGRPDLRRRHRRRRGQHELLHRPVAVQLPGQPGRHRRPSRPSNASSDRPPSGRSTTRSTTACCRWRRRATRRPISGNPTVDDTSPDYPPEAAKERERSTTPASRCRPSPRGVVGSQLAGPSKPQGLLLQLRHRAGRRLGARWRRVRHARTTPVTRATTCWPPTPARWPQLNGELNPDGTPQHPFVVRDCQGADLRVLPVPAGHLDGRTARRWRGALGRGPVRPAGPLHPGKGLDPGPDPVDSLDRTETSRPARNRDLFEYTRIRADGRSGRGVPTAPGR